MARDITIESVPTFTRRAGDFVIEGSNNVTVIWGTDRPSNVDSGYEKKAGTWHVITGRKESDPNFSEDLSFIYASMKSDPDKYLDIESIESSEKGVPTVILKSDTIRLVSRKDLKICVGDCYMYMNQDGTVKIDGKIHLGKSAIESILKGDIVKAYIDSHTHPTPAGLSGPPMIPLPDNALSKKSFVF